MSKIYQTSWPDKTVTKGVEVILEVEVKMVTTRAIPVLLLIQCFQVQLQIIDNDSGWIGFRKEAQPSVTTDMATPLSNSPSLISIQRLSF